VKDFSRRNGMSTLVAKKDPKAVSVEVGKDILKVTLADGRVVSAPLEWFPKLRDATKKQRNNWRLIGAGVGIRWPDLDEDVSIDGLLI
jgi:hypothetical protein